MVKLLNVVNVPIYQKGLFLCWNEVLGASAGPLAMLQLSCSKVLGFWRETSAQEKRTILQVAPKNSCLPTYWVLLNMVTAILSSCEGAPRASVVDSGPEDYSNCTARIKCMTSEYLQDMNKNNRAKGKMQS